MGGDDESFGPFEEVEVSIHAPAWGATVVLSLSVFSRLWLLYSAKPAKNCLFTMLSNFCPIKNSELQSS
jgi:hypothetical protein